MQSCPVRFFIMQKIGSSYITKRFPMTRGCVIILTKLTWASSRSLGGKVQNSLPICIFFMEMNCIFFFTPRLLWPEGVSSFRPLSYGLVQCHWKETCISVPGPYLFMKNNANIILHSNKMFMTCGCVMILFWDQGHWKKYIHVLCFYFITFLRRNTRGFYFTKDLLWAKGLSWTQGTFV